jgi:hypothetical protein
MQVAQLLHSLVDRLADTPSLHHTLAAFFRTAWPRFYHYATCHSPKQARAALSTAIVGGPDMKPPEATEASVVQPFYISAAASPDNPPGLSLLFVTAATAACGGSHCARDTNIWGAFETALANVTRPRALAIPPGLRGILFALFGASCCRPSHRPCECRSYALDCLLAAAAAELPAAPPLLRPETLSQAFLVAAEASRRRFVVAARLPVDPLSHEMVSSSFAHGIEVSLWLPAQEPGEHSPQVLGAYVHLQHACAHRPRRLAACIGIAVASEAGEKALEAAARNWCEEGVAIRLKPRPGMWATKLLGSIVVGASGAASCCQRSVIMCMHLYCIDKLVRTCRQ